MQVLSIVKLIVLVLFIAVGGIAAFLYVKLKRMLKEDTEGPDQNDQEFRSIMKKFLILLYCNIGILCINIVVQIADFVLKIV